jgi:hypothetical protein
VRKIGGILERHIRIRIVVASETILGCRQMCRRRLSGGDIAVMALHAIVGVYTYMDKDRIGKVCGVMANGTILGRRNVTERLAGSDCIVVAIRA